MRFKYEKSQTHTDTAAGGSFPLPLFPFDPALSDI